MSHPTLFRRRLLTVAAIVLMISSALLSFFLVQENDRHLADLRRSEEKMDQAIRTLWERMSEADRTADTAVIVSLLAKDSTPETAELKRYYLERAGMTQPTASLMEVVKAADTARSRSVDGINDIYLSRIDVENEIMAREAANKRTADFAFLLQLMSLVLIILTREMPGG